MIGVLEGGGTGLAGSRIGPLKIFRSSTLASPRQSGFDRGFPRREFDSSAQVRCQLTQVICVLEGGGTGLAVSAR